MNFFFLKSRCSVCNQLSIVDRQPSSSVPDEQDILNKFTSLLDKRYLPFVEISLRKNRSKSWSIVVYSRGTAYREATAEELLFARLKIQKGSILLSFNNKYAHFFRTAGIDFLENKSTFIQVPFNSVFHSNEDQSSFSFVFQSIFKKLFNFDDFGCCSRYIECSNAKHCVHPDIIFATACQYGANLENGKIFYGENRNIG